MRFSNAVKEIFFKPVLCFVTLLSVSVLFNSPVSGQIMKMKTEELFLPGKQLAEQQTDYYDNSGKIVKSIDVNFKVDTSLTITDYFYDSTGLLIQEVFSGVRSYVDSSGARKWTDTSIIDKKLLFYDSEGKLRLKKKYGFECRLDTCDITEYFYTGKLLARKFKTNACSNQKYNYPIYYKYNKNDSLVMEQAFGPTDTSKIWYQYSYNYDSFPDKFISEWYYRTGDSLVLERRSVIKNDYHNGKKIKVTYLESPGKYDTIEYNKKGLLQSITKIDGNKPFRKLIYTYDKRNNVILIETFERREDKLNLHYYQKYTYTYY